MDYNGTTGWQIRSIKFEDNEVVIIFKDLKTPFYWEWKVKGKPTFRTAGNSRTLYQMQLKLVEDFTLKSKLKSLYKKEYLEFVGNYWPIFLEAILCEIKSANDFLVLFLEELSSDVNDNIRWKVAKNPFTPKHIAEKLSKTDPINSIRMIAVDSMQKSLLYSYKNTVNGNPESIDIFEFFEWLDNASILELEDFSNKSFEENPLSLVEKFLGWLSIFIPNEKWKSYRIKYNKPTQYEIYIIK